MFDSVWIERMEMLILGALKWRMRSINPFSFLNYFIPFFNSNSNSNLQLDIQALKNRATHIILKSQNGWLLISKISFFIKLNNFHIYLIYILFLLNFNVRYQTPGFQTVDYLSIGPTRRISPVFPNAISNFQRFHQRLHLCD